MVTSINPPLDLMSQAMVSQGSGGAFEVSQRMTALLGWGGTTKFAEDVRELGKWRKKTSG